MQKRQYSRSRERPFGARWLPAFLQPCHSHRVVSARTGACLGPRGAMRILSNSFESKLMDGYDACGGYASSLDILQTAMPRRFISGSLHDFFTGPGCTPRACPFCPLTSRNAQRKTPRMLVKDDITRKLQVAFAPDSVEVIDESDQHH